MGNKASSSTSISNEDIVRLENAKVNLEKSPLAAELPSFRASLDCQVLTPSDTELYMQARTRPFNQDMRGFPILIVQARSSSDVSKTVNFMRDFGGNVGLCICCGGHSNRCMITDTVVIDLQHMNNVSVNTEDKVVHIGGGAYLEQVDKALAPVGFGTVYGTYPYTGVGGLVLAGGYGWLARSYGLSVDNLIEIEIVLADGRIVVANDNNEFSRVLIGCRGGGGNFGVVTRFTMRIYKLPTYCYGGDKVFLTPTLKSAVEVCVKCDQIVQDMPNRTCPLIIFPAGAPVVPTSWVTITDDKIEEIEELRAASRCGGWVTVSDSVKSVSLHNDVQRMTMEHIESGFVYTSLIQIGSNDSPLPKSFFEELLTYTRKTKSSKIAAAVVILFRMGGVVATGTELQTTINPTTRRARYFAILESRWTGAAGDAGRDACRQWVKQAYATMSKYRCGPQMKHGPLDVVEGCSDELKLTDIAAHDLGFDDHAIQLLGEIKTEYDPHNFFKNNLNVLPK